MRFRFIALTYLAVAALTACTIPAGTGSIPSAPVVAADKTVLDEKAALGAELAYQAARTAAELAVDAGLIKGETARKVADADNRAYRALGAARAAYRAGNASSYSAALDEARAAVSEILSLVKGVRP